MARRRRAYGTGSLYIENGVYYGRWYTAAGGYANRRVGPVRNPGSRDGLTRKAEAKLRAMIDGAGGRVMTDPSRTVEHVGHLHSAKLSGQGRKISHVETFDSHVRVHLAPFFKEMPINRIDATDVERLMATLQKKGLAPKTIKNIVGTLHSTLDYALRKHCIAENPCRLVDKPDTEDSDPDIRFLTVDELEAVLRKIPAQDAKGKLSWGQVRNVRASTASNRELARELGISDSLISRIRRGVIWTDQASTENLYVAIDHALILTAALSGMRQGELLALRWQDVDWLVQKARVRRAYVRGQFGPPKSKRSSRGVPLSLCVAGALDDLHRRSAFQADDELAFGHPYTGEPLDRSQVLKRFKRYCKAAGIQKNVRFHDLRHTFGTRMAAVGTPLRTLQEWMGHADSRTTQRYADYAPSENEAATVDAAFAAETVRSVVQSERN